MVPTVTVAGIDVVYLCPLRRPLLMAIAAAPDDDLPRLVYSDFLEENFGNCDQSKATVEFIRLSCRSKKSTHMPRALYPWLSKMNDEHAVYAGMIRRILNSRQNRRTPFHQV